MDKAVEDFLKHSGVLGMHWGVRKEEETNPRQPGKTDGSANSGSRSRPQTAANPTPQAITRIDGLSAKQRASLISTGSALVIGGILTSVILRRRLPMALLKKELKHTVELGANFKVTSDVVLPVGSKFFRVAGKTESRIDAPKYAAYSKRDVLNYKKDWVARDAEDAKKIFKTGLHAKGDVKIASPDSMERMATKLFSGTDEAAKAFQVQAKEHALQGLPLIDKVTDPAQLGRLFIGASRGSNWTNPSEKAFLDYAKAQGYSGLTDINNTGNIAQHAVILFDEHMFKVTGEVLSRSERLAARKAFDKLDPALRKWSISNS